MSMKMLRLLAAILTIGLLAAACGGDDDESAVGSDCEAGQTDGDLNLYNWAEYIDPELKTQFEEEFGVTVNEDNYDSNEQMQPIISQGNSGYDLIVPSDYMVSILIEGGDIAPINRSAVPNLSNLADEFASGLPFDPDATYSVPYQWGTTGLGVDLSVVGEDVPQTWGLIFDADLAAEYGLEGAMTILNDPRETMGAALKYLGYSLNTTDQGQLDEAKAIVADATSRVAAYESDQYDALSLFARVLQVVRKFRGIRYCDGRLHTHPTRSNHDGGRQLSRRGRAHREQRGGSRARVGCAHGHAAQVVQVSRPATSFHPRASSPPTTRWASPRWAVPALNTVSDPSY